MTDNDFTDDELKVIAECADMSDPKTAALVLRKVFPDPARLQKAAEAADHLTRYNDGTPLSDGTVLMRVREFVGGGFIGTPASDRATERWFG